MADAGLKALEAELRGKAPAGLCRLSDEELRDLAEAIRSARRRQAADLAAALEESLSHIPKLLRGPVRKVVR